MARNWDGFKKQFFNGANVTNMDSINFLDNFLAIFTFKYPSAVLTTRRTLDRQVNNSKTLDMMVTDMILKRAGIADFFQLLVEQWFNKMDMKRVFRYFFSTLWFSRLPCYDVTGITGEQF